MDDRELQRLEDRLSRLEEKVERLFRAVGVPAEDSQYGAEGASARSPVAWRRPGFGWEYRSATTLMGLPLIHIATGVDPHTWRPRVAKGWIAIGNIAVGGLAIGGLAFGVIPIGGLAIGLAALGGAAIGLLAFGGAAIGYIAVGGGAVGYYAVGGGALGAHVICADRQDPAAVEFFGRYVPGLVESLGRAHR